MERVGLVGQGLFELAVDAEPFERRVPPRIAALIPWLLARLRPRGGLLVSPPGPDGIVEHLRSPEGGDPRRRHSLHQDTARPSAPRPTCRLALPVHMGKAEVADLPQPHQSDQGRAIRVRRAATARPEQVERSVAAPITPAPRLNLALGWGRARPCLPVGGRTASRRPRGPWTRGVVPGGLDVRGDRIGGTAGLMARSMVPISRSGTGLPRVALTAVSVASRRAIRCGSAFWFNAPSSHGS